MSKREEAPKKKNNLKNIISVSNICFVITIVIIIVAGLIVPKTINIGAEAAKDAYEEAKVKAATDVEQKFYDIAYASAERKHHVSNEISIDVSSVKEKAELEVLQLSDAEYLIKEEDDIEYWLKFEGKGVYTVDMRASEFIIDSNRQYVMVRVPKPAIKITNVEKSDLKFFENNRFFSNGNYAKGEELAVNAYKEGYSKIRTAMTSDSRSYKKAKESATSVITNLIKGLNNEYPDLVVEVEFFDIDGNVD